jgi:hypothetical protein
LKYLNSIKNIDDNDSLLFHTLNVIYQLSIIKEIDYIIEYFINKGLYHLIKDFINRDNDRIKDFVIKILGNLLSLSDISSQILLNQGILNTYKYLLENESFVNLKEIIWGLSNIAAGTSSQIDLLYKEGFVTKIMQLINNLIVEDIVNFEKYYEKEYKVKVIFI